MKKTWVRPELVILVRGSDGERVLDVCKDGTSNGGPEAYKASCMQGELPPYGCPFCSSPASS